MSINIARTIGAVGFSALLHHYTTEPVRSLRRDEMRKRLWIHFNIKLLEHGLQYLVVSPPHIAPH